jgi:hypothetical protein
METMKIYTLEEVKNESIDVQGTARFKAKQKDFRERGTRMKTGSALLLLICLTVSLHTQAYDNLRRPDTRTLGLAGSEVVYSPLFNPSLTAFHAHRQVRGDYFDPYGLKELGTVSAGLSIPNRILPFGVHIASFGYDKYRENMFRLSVSKRLSGMWSLGVSVQYALLQSEIFEQDGQRLSADVGVALRPTDTWLFGLSVLHFPAVSIGSDETNQVRMTPLTILAGARYAVAEAMELSVEAGYKQDEPFLFTVGVEYTPFTDFRLRAGVKSVPFSPSLGVSYSLIGMTLDTVLYYHPVLGSSLGIGLAYSF